MFEDSQIFYYIVLIAFLLMSLFSRPMKKGVLINGFLAWGIIFLFFITIYSFREPIIGGINRVYFNLFPYMAKADQNGNIIFQKSSNGHFMLNIKTNDRNIKYMLDTGATKVCLTIDDARKIGINTDNLTFSMPFKSANGIGYAAPIIIKKMRVGHINLKNVPAFVNNAKMQSSLLGMSFISKLKSFNMSGDYLILS